MNANQKEMIDYYNNHANHLLSRPSKEAFFYFPNISEIIELNKDKPECTNRKIFEGACVLTHTDFEKKSFEEINKAIIEYNLKKQKKPSEKIIFPVNFNSFLIHRFHQSTNYNCDKTIEALLEYCKYREVNKNTQLNSNVLEILNSGCIYVHGRDCRFRPIIVMNIEIFCNLKDKYQTSDFETTALKFIDYIVDNMLIPGQVENWVTIIYMGDASLFNIPDSVKKLMVIVQNNYRCRLHKSFIIGLSSFMTFLWEMIKYIIDLDTVKKFNILKNDELHEIQKLINSKQLEKRFGGEAPNCANKFLFPPREVSNEYLLPTDVKDQLLMKQETYLKTIYENKKIVECPYLKSEILRYKSK